MTLEQVLPYLGPTDELQEQYKKARGQLVEDVAQLARANLLEGEQTVRLSWLRGQHLVHIVAARMVHFGSA